MPLADTDLAHLVQVGRIIGLHSGLRRLKSSWARPVGYPVLERPRGGGRTKPVPGFAPAERGL